MKTNRLRFYLACTLILAAFSSAHAFITVGQTNDCDYDNLLDAYLAADVFVGVTNEITYNDSFIISKAKWITGGYDSCADAVAGTPGGNKTRWSRIDDGTVVAINANQVGPSVVVLSNFEIFGGDNTGLSESGGISIAGNSHVLITNSEFYNNQGELGGGIKVSGNQAKLTLNNVVVRDNNASSNGGGIYCESNATVKILGDSSIRSNTAENQGGGIYANSACELSSESGDTAPAVQAQLGIVSNTAWQGGGVYLSTGATMQLTGNTEHPASVVFNTSITNEDEGGGGLFLVGAGTRVDAVNARIELNISEGFGAGAGVYNQAVLTMNRLNSKCWGDNKCSILANNIAQGEFAVGGAIDIYNAGTAAISQTHITGNRANEVAAINVDKAGYLRLEGNLITDNKHWNDSTETQLFSMGGEAGNGGNIDFFYNTLVNNEAGHVFNLYETAQHTLNIHNSIIKHQGLILNENNNNNNLISTDCVFLTEQASLTGNIGAVLLTDPGFVDAANGDYQLSASSDAIDLCDEQLFIGAAYNDLNGSERGYDDPNVDNFLGPHDAGAFEFNDDLIFKNNFE